MHGKKHKIWFEVFIRFRSGHLPLATVSPLGDPGLGHVSEAAQQALSQEKTQKVFQKSAKGMAAPTALKVNTHCTRRVH